MTQYVYVGEMPRLARDITTRALADIGYGVLDAPPDPTQLRALPDGTILIAARAGARLAWYERRLLAVLPEAVVIVFDPDGRGISRFELWPRRLPLGELCAETIAAAVRTPPTWDERFRD